MDSCTNAGRFPPAALVALENVGVELSAKSGAAGLCANLAWARQKATDPVSNQFLFDNAMTADRRLRRRFLALD